MRNLFASLIVLLAATQMTQAQTQQRAPAQPQPQVQVPPPAPQVPPTASTQPVPSLSQNGIQPVTPVGIWLTEEDKSRVQVTDCPGGLCARIIWLKDPADKRGRPWTDQLNKNVALRGQPIIGLELFNPMRPAARNVWKGWIYNPEDGDRFDVTFTLTAPDKIAIKGCVFFICETHYWRRYLGN